MTKKFEGKRVLGLLEKVTLISGKKKNVAMLARIDTGATKSSIDTNLASDLKLGPVIKSKLFKSAHGSRLRPVIRASLILASRRIKAEFSLADRRHMRYRVLIGQNILKKGFLIDPSK